MNKLKSSPSIKVYHILQNVLSTEKAILNFLYTTCLAFKKLLRSHNSGFFLQIIDQYVFSSSQNYVL